MKRKLFTFLMAFLAIAGNAVWAQEQEYTVLQSEKAVDVSGNGKHYYTTNGETINKGGINVTGGSPTIYLKDFKIKVDGSAITISNMANPTFVLLGENEITSAGIGGAAGYQNKAAIDIAKESSLTISEESTGFLNINMTSTKSGEKVAIGGGGTGTVGDYDFVDATSCGSLNIYGGTIVTNGYVGGFYDHAIRLEKTETGKGGNGILITQKIYHRSDDYTKNNCQLESGILFENNTVGTVYGQPTLNSPIPEGYQVNMDGATVTVGEGKSYTEEQFKDLDKGTLKAYALSYKADTPEGLSITDPKTLPGKQFVGINTPLISIKTTIPVNSYHFWGWLNKDFYTATPSSVPSKLEPFEVSGVWIVDICTVEKEKSGENVSVDLVYPTSAASMFIATLKEGDALPNDLKLEGMTVSGTLNETKTANYNVSLKDGGSETKTSVLKFTVKDEEQGGGDEPEPETPTDISTGYTIENDKLKDLVYKAEDLDVEIIVKNLQTGEVLDAKNYSVEITPKQIYNAGKYTVKVTGKDGYSGSFEGSFEVAQKEVIAAASTIECEINPGDLNYKEEVEFTFDTNPEFGGVYEKDKDQVWVVWDGDKPWGDFNLGAAGSYKVTYLDATLGGDQAKNYKLAADPTGNIVVGKPQGGDDEDKTDLASQVSISIKDEGKIFVYNGDVQEQDATRLVIVENKETGDIYEENVDFKVEIGHGNTSNFEEAPFKLAGNYSIRIVPIESEDSNLKGESQVLENVLTIYPRKVAVKANPLYYTIGKEDEVNLKDVIVEIEDENTGICEEDKGFVSIRLVNNPQLSEAYKEPGIYTFTYKVELLNASPNYTITNDGEVDGLIYVMKNITDEDPMNPGSMEEGNDSDISLQEGWEYVNENIYKRLYDGLKHPLHTIYVKVMKDNEPTWVALQEEREEFSISGVEGEIKNAGHYNLEITLNGEKNKLYDGKVKITLVIIPAQLSVDLNLPVEVKSDDDLASIWSAEDAIIEGEVNGEKGKIEGTLSEVKREGNIMTVTVDGLALKENGAFLPGNYEPIYKNHGTEVTIDEATGKPYVELKIEDAKAEDLKPGEGEGWTEINGTYTRVYDGKEHLLTSITVDGVSMTEGFTVDYNGADKVKDAGTYLATVTFTDGKYAPTTMVLTIQQRPMEITFDLPETIKEGETLDIHALIRYQQMGEDCGLIDAEGEPVIKSGQLVVTAPYDNGRCAVILKDFLLEKNESGFNPANYGLKVWDATIKDWAAYENDGNDPDITLTDPTNPDEENPNGEGGSGITVDDGDDDNPDNPDTDPDEPDTDPDDPSTDPNKPINPNPGDKPSKPSHNPYKHYNVLIEDVCDGIELSTSRDVVREGNQVSIYMEIAEGCDTTGMKLEYKRGQFGYWEDLKLLEGVQPGEYIIKHIYTDIYVRATGAKMDGSATGIEDLGDAQTKVYTQDGRIYVYAPERADVQIVNMAGVVVQRSEQIGLQAYDRLNLGIYIVRVGDEVFKVKL